MGLGFITHGERPVERIVDFNATFELLSFVMLTCFLLGSTRTPNREKQPCTGEECQSSKTTFGYILLSIGGALVAIGVVVCCCLVAKGKSTPSTRTEFDAVPTSEIPMSNNPESNIQMSDNMISDVNIFQSGTWSSGYFQYGEWHGQHEFLLSFDDGSQTVNGHGKDDMGSYTITGQYSTETNEIELRKAYQEATGDLSENLEHDVTIEVTWNSMKHLFEGKWYVDTPQFRGEDAFELILKKPSELRTNQTYNYL